MSRPSLLVVSPLPPTWSGIADYTSGLLPHLAEDWDVTVLVGDDDPPPSSTLDVRVIPMSNWEWARHLLRPHRILICHGNSRYHLHVPTLTARHGGVVLAHDVRMTVFQCLVAAKSPDPHQLSTVVWERHGRELGSEIRSVESRSSVEESFAELRGRLENANCMLLAASLPGAHEVLVHSKLAARLARIELHGTAIPVEVVPFGHPPTKEIQRRPLSARISSFGMVEPVKRPDTIVESMAYVRREVPDATLRFVGTLGGGMESLLTSISERVGVRDAVSWTDHVDREAYSGELGAADIAVQLRAQVNGEASAAVAECLAAGIPTIISDIGGHAELPASAVLATPAGCSPYQLSGSITALLTDGKRKSQLSGGASRYAKSSSFEVSARALTRVLEAAPPPREIG